MEAAITLPLVVFLILGTLQLFLALQARVLAQYAVFQATRAGSISHGSCERMQDAAVLALIPSFRSFLGNATPGASPGAKLTSAFSDYKSNGHRFRGDARPGLDAGHTGSIVWIMRELGGSETSVPDDQHRDFDQPGELMRLETRMVYWFPLKIPFANWVLSRMYQARLGLQNYDAANPLIPADKNAGWTRGTMTSFNLPGAVAGELMARASREEYTFPIETTFTMRMMTPAKERHFTSMNCPW